MDKLGCFLNHGGRKLTSDETIIDDLASSAEGENTQRDSTKLVNVLEKVSGTMAKKPHDDKEALSTFPCPYCKGDAYLHASHCKSCGKDLVQFIAAIDMLRGAQTQDTANAEVAQVNKLPEPSLDGDNKPESFLATLKGFVHAAAMPSLLFLILSFVTLWSTQLKTSESGPLALVIGVFLLCLSVGATHVRECMGGQPSKWRLALWGTALGLWIAVLQTALHFILDKHVPMERAEYFELLNTVLGVLFAYVSGAAIPIAQRLIGIPKLGLAELPTVLWRVRFSLISGAFALLIGFLK